MNLHDHPILAWIVQHTYGKVFYAYAVWRLKRTFKAAEWIYRYGRVRDIETLGRELAKLGKWAEDDQVIRLGHEIEQEASNIVLQRVFPKIKINLTPME
jgi:hypothetical protein